jgi:hypothetical protein
VAVGLTHQDHLPTGRGGASEPESGMFEEAPMRPGGVPRGKEIEARQTTPGTTLGKVCQQLGGDFTLRTPQAPLNI